MSSPWLTIPLADYEGHMQSSDVQQLSALADLFAAALAHRHPASVAILGIAGGNGLSRIDPALTHRVVGLDVNPEYLEDVQRRHTGPYALELHCVDLAREAISIEPVQMVHAALIFEHTGVQLALQNAVSLVAPGGALTVVLQLPSAAEAGVSASPFPALQRLQPHFAFIDPAWLVDTLTPRGFRLVHEVRQPLPSGKAFWMGILARNYMA